MELLSIQMLFLFLSFLFTSVTALTPIIIVWFKFEQDIDEQVRVISYKVLYYFNVSKSKKYILDTKNFIVS